MESAVDEAGDQYLTLVSSDGFEYVVLKEAALVSPAIKSMVTGLFAEATSGRCVLQDIRVVEYFHYWYLYRDKADIPDMDIPPELCLEMLVAADFLGLDDKNRHT